eukprot:g16599.t1
MKQSVKYCLWSQAAVSSLRGSNAARVSNLRGKDPAPATSSSVVPKTNEKNGADDATTQLAEGPTNSLSVTVVGFGVTVGLGEYKQEPHQKVQKWSPDVITDIVEKKTLEQNREKIYDRTTLDQLNWPEKPIYERLFDGDMFKFML